MSPQKTQYKAYSLATHTVAKTKQVVMLYDGTIRFLKQAMQALTENRIEDRFKLLKKASDVMTGLQSSIDFDNGGEVAQTLFKFYTRISMRILAVNFNKTTAKEECAALIDELKQMRDVWDNIDRGLNTAPSLEIIPVITSGNSKPSISPAENTSFSA